MTDAERNRIISDYEASIASSEKFSQWIWDQFMEFGRRCEAVQPPWFVLMKTLSCWHSTSSCRFGNPDWYRAGTCYELEIDFNGFKNRSVGVHLVWENT